jgi:hypothetical protein
MCLLWSHIRIKTLTPFFTGRKIVRNVYTDVTIYKICTRCTFIFTNNNIVIFNTLNGSFNHWYFLVKMIKLLVLQTLELFCYYLHLSSTPVFSGVRVTRSLVLYVCFVDRCLSLCTFSFDHCVFCFFLRYADYDYLPLVSSNSSYWQYDGELDSRSGRGVQHYVIKFVNKTDRHDITEILLKVALNTITLISTNKHTQSVKYWNYYNF